MNGNFKSLADIKGKELYPGQAGTETNPYGIEDVFDFCAIKNDTDKETTYYQLVNNIDFNDHPAYKNGITEKDIIYATASIIDGNGKSIRNIVWYNAGGASGATSFICEKMINCNFENLVIATGNSMNSTFETEFEKCSFYILCQNATFINAFYDSYSRCSLTDCTLNIAGTSITKMDFGYIRLLRCHINFDNYTTQINIRNPYGCDIFLNAKFDHVYFTGSLHFSNGLDPIDFIYDKSLFKNCYYCVDTTAPMNAAAVKIGQSADATSFYNKDLIRINGSKNGGTNFYALTDAQCKDATYLASIGFPVIGV